jgi:hypothetical protein
VQHAETLAEGRAGNGGHQDAVGAADLLLNAGDRVLLGGIRSYRP